MTRSRASRGRRGDRHTLRLDVEAYERLKAAKNPGETFSQVIMRLFKPPPALRPLGKRAEIE